MNLKKLGLNSNEIRSFKKLNSPIKVQDYLDKCKINFELDGIDTFWPPRIVLEKKQCHCAEAAAFAAACIWINEIGKPLFVRMFATEDDWDHAICVFKINNKWGAISKSNHSVLRYRDPVYSNIHELVMSYFHEYTDEKNKGNKTLRKYALVNLEFFGNSWLASKENLWDIIIHFRKIKHKKVITKKQLEFLRRADKISILAGNLTEWTKHGKKIYP